MKIAICISGHLRTFAKTFPAFAKHLLSPDHQFDVYIHTWDKLGWYGPSDAEKVDVSTYDVLSDVEKFYSPKHLVVEPFVQFDASSMPVKNPKWVKPGTRGESIFGMYYSLQKCHELRRGVKYDLVVRTRADIFHERPINFGTLAGDPSALYVPHLGHSGGVNDQFAIGTPEVMDLYAGVFPHLKEYVSEGCPWRPEPLLYWHIRDKVNLLPQRFRYHLLRVNGTITHNKGYRIGLR